MCVMQSDNLNAFITSRETWYGNRFFGLRISDKHVGNVYIHLCADIHEQTTLFFVQILSSGIWHFSSSPDCSDAKCGRFRCCAHTLVHRLARIRRMPFEKAPNILVSFFNSQRSFHLFILRQESRDSVCSVPPQIKHSLCIPYEMYLLRFGRGGCQVLGYIKSKPSPHRERTNETGNQARHLS